MTFYADPSFFMLLALAVAGAAFLGLREKPIARYGMVASVAFLACLFCKDLPGAYAVVAGVIVGLIALCALPVVQRLARWLLHFLPDTGRWAERRESWLKQLDALSAESRHLLADKPRCAAILGVHLVKLFLLFCLPWRNIDTSAIKAE